MQNQMKIYYRAFTAVSCLLGLILVIWPSQTMRLVSYVLGGLIILIGLVKSVLYFLQKDFAGFYHYDLVIGIVCVGMGVFLLFKPEVVSSIFPIVLGVIVIISSLLKLQNSLDLRRNNYKGWWSILIFAILGVALGGVMIFYSFGTMVTLVRFIGGVLIANSVMDTISLICVNHKINQMEKIMDAMDTVETDGEVL